MTDRIALFIGDADIHRQIKIAAAEQGVSMKALTERLLRLGMAVDSTPNGATARELRSASLALAGTDEAALEWANQCLSNQEGSNAY